MSMDRYRVTNDPARADFDSIEAMLRTSYWAAERARDVIEASFRPPASIPFFVLDASAAADVGKTAADTHNASGTTAGLTSDTTATLPPDTTVQPTDPTAGRAATGGTLPPLPTIGFGRVVTDRLTIGWVCDVMIHPAHRGTGVGKLLVQAIVTHPDLNRPGVRLILGTKDAHGLYEQFGFFRRELMWRHPMAAEPAGF